MLVHVAFDLLAWLTAALLGVVISRADTFSPRQGARRSPIRGISSRWDWARSTGAILVGSLNLNLAGTFAIGHSIAGGIIGGIVGVEAV